MPHKNKLNCLRMILIGGLTSMIPVSQAERADRNQPVKLEAEQVSIDDAKQISTFTGNVLLTQGTLTIRGDKLVVKQNQEGLQHSTATGQLASFRQKRDGVDEYVEGYGQRIEYDSANTTMELRGQARIKRGLDEVSSEYITYNSTTEIFKADSLSESTPGGKRKGRVRVIIQPKADPAPPATPLSENTP